MANYRVTCITTSVTPGTHEDITHIGNSFEGWIITSDEAIAKINARTDGYYVIEEKTGKIAYLVVVCEEGKQAYLQVQNNEGYNDNLLGLGLCYI